jgi:hypothetical protein
MFNIFRDLHRELDEERERAVVPERIQKLIREWHQSYPAPSELIIDDEPFIVIHSVVDFASPITVHSPISSTKRGPP